MRRRVLFAILSITTLAIVLFGVPLAVMVTRFVDREAALRVERQAVLASRDVPADFAASNDPVELPEPIDGISFALYNRDGRLVAGDGPSQADAATRQALANRVTDITASGARVVGVPVSANEQVIGVIRAEQSTAPSDARARRIIAWLGLLALAVLAIGAAIGYFVAGRLARPVRRLRDSAVKLGEGDFTVNVPRSRVPELDQAGQAITATAARLGDLVSRERSFSADASHQLRTPLAGLRAAIETEIEFPRPDSTAVLHEALTDIDRLERTIVELLTIARTPAQEQRSFELGRVLREIEATWHGPLAKLGRQLEIEMTIQTTEGLLVRGNAAMLRHALDALLDNAIQHGTGIVRIVDEVSVETVTISISDEGPAARPTATGISELHGHGLALARRLIEAMPGRLTVIDEGPSYRVELLLRRTNGAAVGTVSTTATKP